MMRLLAVLAIVTAGGCGGDRQRAQPAESDRAVTQTATVGPVTLTLTVRPADLPFNRRAEVIVEAVAGKDAAVELSDYLSGLEDGEHQFEYRLRRGERRQGEATGEGKVRWTQRFDLEFFLPGEYELPPAALTYFDAGASSTVAAETGPLTLKTEPIRVVARATQEAQLSAEELRNIEVLPPVELREPWSPWWLLAPAVVAAAAALWWRFHRLRRPSISAVKPIPAHEWARRQFAALIAEDLIAKGLVQDFYYRISAIVRGYIERRFGVCAPEMTTEEFLATTTSDSRFDGGATGELQHFLTACDLVKYARQRPAPGEWDDLLRTARDFVERTREAESRNTDIRESTGSLEAATA